MKSVKTIQDNAPDRRDVLPDKAPNWSLPDGRALAEFALASGFLAPQLMGAGPERLSEVNEDGLASDPLRTRPK